MSDVSSAASSAAAPLLVNGLISGIDTTSVIQALLQAYQAPITNLQTEQTTLNTQAGDYRTLNSDMQAVLTAAESLNTTSQWNLMNATSANSAIATATSSAGALAGTIGFTVEQLAQGNVLLSAGGVSSEAASVSSASSLLAATGAAGIGFSGLQAGSGLALGSHAISVTQSSAAATVDGTGTLAATTNIDSSNDTLTLEVNGSEYDLTLADGSYTSSQLAAAVNTAAGGSVGAPITASLTTAGTMQLSTTEQGSDASITVSGGTALDALGLAAAASSTGTDAVVSVDGTETTLSNLSAGATVTLDAPSGSISATVASSAGPSGALVSTGSASAALVSTGTGSLQSLVQNLNASGLALSATAVQEAGGQYRLQIAAGTTGLSGAVSIDDSALSSGPLGGIGTITNAQNADVNVGGSGGYDLQSATNTFENLMPGTAITVAGLGATTVTVSPNAAGEAGAVSNLVAAANQALSDISNLAGYNASTKTAGPLMGSAVIQGIQQSILQTVAGAVGSSSVGSAADVGITLSSSGSLSFDESTFEQAYDANPAGVAALFSAGGSFSAGAPQYAGEVSFVYANTGTASGSYDVSISQSAAEAIDEGATVPGGVVSTGETLEFSSGDTDASYETSAGQSLTAIAAGLNQLFSQNGLELSAVVNGNSLGVQSDAFGSAASFSVSTSAPGAGTTGLGGAEAGDAVSYSGTDVAGTINGVAATGSGQVLTAPSTDPTLAGLSLLVTAPGITSATDLGTFTYAPGLAQQLASLADAASNAGTGSLTNAIKGLSDQATGLNGQIANYTALEQSQQTLLTNQFAQMEETLGTLKNESSALSSQISDLSGF